MLRVKYQFNCFEEDCCEIISYDKSRTIESLQPSWRGPYICVLNGQPVSRDDWDCEISEKDELIFKAVPTSFLAAPWFVYSLLTVSIVAGLYLAKRININNPNENDKSPSPTYNISLSGNRMRLNESVPVIYGTHILVPDLACHNYIEYNTQNEQIYKAIFCIGANRNFKILKILIDDTDISSYSNVDIQYQGPNFPSQAIGNVYRDVITAPEVSNIELQYNKPSGGFSVCGPGVAVSSIALDVVLPRGLYGTNPNGTIGLVTVLFDFQARLIDDAGNSIGFWFNLGTATKNITDATIDVIRKTYFHSVAVGRYEVRGVRINQKIQSPGVANEIQWTGLKGYVNNSLSLPSDANFMGVSIKADSQLSSESQRKFSIIMSVELPTWNPQAGWSTVPNSTSNPAWVVADILRNSVYSEGLADTHIDLDSLYQLSQTCESRLDEFNGVFDKKTNVWAAISAVLNVCRTKPVIKVNKISFIRDEKQPIPVFLFSKRNIKKDSFLIEYSFFDEDSPEIYELEYFNENRWSSDWVTVNSPGFLNTYSSKISRQSLIQGITNEKQAKRECAFIAAREFYRRKVISFTTEMEGLICSYGDLVSVSIDLLNWGQDGEVISYDEENKIVTSSEKLTYGSNNQVSFSSLQGDYRGPYLIQPVSETSFILQNASQGAGFYINTDFNYERTKFQLSNSNSLVKICKIIEISPQGKNEVSIKCHEEDSRVYDYDAGYF
jgi:hypothetical protein